MSNAVSIVTKYDQICAFCGRPSQCMHHLIFGSSGRKLSTEDGLTIPVCNACHNFRQQMVDKRVHPGMGTMVIHGNSMAELMSKMIGQLAYEKHYIAEHPGTSEDEAREIFMARYGRSYL